MNPREELEILLASDKSIYELEKFRRCNYDMILYMFVSEIEYYTKPTYTTLDKISNEILINGQGTITIIKLGDLNPNDLMHINVAIVHHELADAS